MIQLADHGPSLNEARACLQRAVDLGDGTPNPHLELGHFTFAVADDAKASLNHFDHAFALSRRLLQDALVGKAKALAELDRREDPLACLAETYWFQDRILRHCRGVKGKEILEQLQEFRLAD